VTLLAIRTGSCCGTLDATGAGTQPLPWYLLLLLLLQLSLLLLLLLLLVEVEACMCYMERHSTLNQHNDGPSQSPEQVWGRC
jgi:hypothetical protein